MGGNLDSGNLGFASNSTNHGIHVVRSDGLANYSTFVVFNSDHRCCNSFDICSVRTVSLRQGEWDRILTLLISRINCYLLDSVGGCVSMDPSYLGS